MASYTFGGATTDAVVLDTLTTLTGDNRQQLVTGWWRPTTLTAGRYLLGLGAVDNGVYVHTTTDELVLSANRVTTDSTDTTTGVDLALDEWKFLAFMSAHENTGALDAWRVWAGTLTTPPTEATVSVSTAGSGNAATVESTFTIGNNNAGSVAFQGQIADIRYVVTSAAAGAAAHPFTTQTSGAISDAEAEFVLQRYVYPAWLGESWHLNLSSRHLVTQHGWWSGYPGDLWRRVVIGGTTFDSFAAPTLTGVTVSAEGPPRRTRWGPFAPDIAAIG